MKNNRAQWEQVRLGDVAHQIKDKLRLYKNVLLTFLSIFQTFSV